MPVQTKICGLSTAATVDAALAGGASPHGFGFFPASPRNIAPDQAAALARRADGRARTVGLFVDPDPDFLASIQRQVGLDIIQLHGHESPEFARSVSGEVWKAIPVRRASDLLDAQRYQGIATRILYDSRPPDGAPVPGGTGQRFDWTVLQGFRHPLPWILAGGLDTGNVAEAVSTTGAAFVDVSSGVESAPGVKDVDKIAAFLKAARDL